MQSSSISYSQSYSLWVHTQTLLMMIRLTRQFVLTLSIDSYSAQTSARRAWAQYFLWQQLLSRLRWLQRFRNHEKRCRFNSANEWRDIDDFDCLIAQYSSSFFAQIDFDMLTTSHTLKSIIVYKCWLNSSANQKWRLDEKKKKLINLCALSRYSIVEQSHDWKRHDSWHNWCTQWYDFNVVTLYFIQLYSSVLSLSCTVECSSFWSFIASTLKACQFQALLINIDIKHQASS